ncbi:MULTISPECIES: hypothetical protein [Cupriavidus]|nr:MULTISPECIES: hypothetical protein [Cupriavidus]
MATPFVLLLLLALLILAVYVFAVRSIFSHRRGLLRSRHHHPARPRHRTN